MSRALIVVSAPTVILSAAKDLVNRTWRPSFAPVRSVVRARGTAITAKPRYRSRMRTIYVYVVASATRTLYVGVTNDIYRRIAEHRAGYGSFTRRYRAHRLVHVELADGPTAAIRREKQLKGWTRAKKVALIESANPKWLDLARGWPPLAQIARSS